MTWSFQNLLFGFWVKNETVGRTAGWETTVMQVLVKWLPPAGVVVDLGCVVNVRQSGNQGWMWSPKKVLGRDDAGVWPSHLENRDFSVPEGLCPGRRAGGGGDHARH